MLILYRYQQVFGLLPVISRGHRDEPPDLRHPDPEKLVKVIGEDTEETHAFNQGD